MSPKRRICLSLVFACICLSKSLLIMTEFIQVFPLPIDVWYILVMCGLNGLSNPLVPARLPMFCQMEKRTTWGTLLPLKLHAVRF